MQTICFIILILFALHLFFEFVALGLQFHFAGAVPVFLKIPRMGRVLMSAPYRPLTPKLNADPASATDIPKKNPLGGGGAGAA